MEIFKEGHMTNAAQKLDEIMAAQSQYWDAQTVEYGHVNQDIPGKAYVVHYLPPGSVMLERVAACDDSLSFGESREVA